MLYALGDPVAFLALLAGFLVAVLARGVAQAWLARAFGVRGFQLEGRTRPDPRRHVDPFGAVAAVLAGPGWGAPAPVEALLGRFAYGGARGRVAARVAAVTLAGPVTAALVGAAFLLGFLATETGVPGLAPGTLLDAAEPADVLHGPAFADTLGTASLALLCAGTGAVALAVMELLPVPPLDGGRLLLAVAPTTPGWQRLRHWADQNWGLIVLLVLLLLPLSPEGPLLLVLVDVLGGLLFDAVGN